MKTHCCPQTMPICDGDFCHSNLETLSARYIPPPPSPVFYVFADNSTTIPLRIPTLLSQA